MKDILNYDELPIEYISNYIGSGENGTIYKIDDNFVFKTFKNPDYFEYNVKEIFPMYLNSFVLPQKLVYVNGKFAGYIMEYINGNTLDKISGNTSINNYIDSLKRLEYDLVALSQHGFFIVDFRECNVMLTENGELKVIDTDFYIKTNANDLYACNLSNLSYAVLKPFLNIYIDGIDNNRLDFYRRLMLEGKYLPSRFMNNIMQYTYTNESNISEFQNQVKLILK